MRRCLALAILSIAAISNAGVTHAATITNGSMDHTGGTNYFWFNGYIAPGWTQDNSQTNTSIYTTSPDIFDPTMTAFDMAWVASPDGGRFAHMLGLLDGENQEGIRQTVTGLVVGQTYEIIFWQSITDANFIPSGFEGQFQVEFGGVTQYSTPMSVPAANTPYGWDLEVMSFVATSTTQDLKFFGKSVLQVEPAYVGLDGVQIRVVPEPSTALLFGLGLAGMATRARPRA